MRKFLLLLIALAGALTVKADSYTYLTFETTDGEKVSVSLESLTITISGTTLTTGSQSFTLTNLSRMYFSYTDETDAIKEVTREALNEATEIYDLQGHKVSNEQLKKGVYIVKTKQGTNKIVTK